MTHPAMGALASMVAPKQKKEVVAPATFDSAEALTYDMTGMRHEVDSVKMDAVSMINELAELESDDLDEGEGLGDRLRDNFISIADVSYDEALTEEDQEIIGIAQDTGIKYLESMGVAFDDVEKLMNDFDNDVADNVAELLRGYLPEGEEATMDSIDKFVFSPESTTTFDEVTFDAMKKFKGKDSKGKTVIRSKRVSGKAKKQSAKQKVASAKRGRNKKAILKRKIAMKKRAKAGFKPNQR